MSYSVEISGSDFTSKLKSGSLNITRGADHRNSCALSIITTASEMGSADGSYIGQRLEVYESTSICFGGVIKTIGMKKLTPDIGSSAPIQIDITSDGYSDIPARRTITESYSSMYAGAIIIDILANVLDMSTADENITSGTITSGIYITSYDAVGSSVKTIFDDLADASGFKWYIDDSRALNFFADDTVTSASHDITESGSFTDYSDVEIGISLENYRNKQFVKGKDNLFVTVSDTSEISARQTAEGSGYSSGVYGNVMEDGNIETETDATTAANNALKRYGSIPYELTFTSMTNDWEAGTKLKVNLPTFGISSDMYFLIESVSIQDVDGANLKSTVSATRRKESDFSTQRTENYIDYFSKIVEGTNGTSETLKRTETAAIDKTAGEISLLLEGETSADTITYTETATGMTFTWPDSFTTTVSIS